MVPKKTQQLLLSELEKELENFVTKELGKLITNTKTKMGAPTKITHFIVSKIILKTIMKDIMNNKNTNTKNTKNLTNSIHFNTPKHNATKNKNTPPPSPLNFEKYTLNKEYYNRIVDQIATQLNSIKSTNSTHSTHSGFTQNNINNLSNNFTSNSISTHHELTKKNINKYTKFNSKKPNLNLTNLNVNEFFICNANSNSTIT